MTGKRSYTVVHRCNAESASTDSGFTVAPVPTLDAARAYIDKLPAGSAPVLFSGKPIAVEVRPVPATQEVLFGGIRPRPKKSLSTTPRKPRAAKAPAAPGPAVS